MAYTNKYGKQKTITKRSKQINKTKNLKCTHFSAPGDAGLGWERQRMNTCLSSRSMAEQNREKRWVVGLFSIFTQPSTKTVESTVASFSNQVNQATAMCLIELSWDTIGQILTCRCQKCFGQLKNGKNAGIVQIIQRLYFTWPISAFATYHSIYSWLPIIILHFIWDNHNFQDSSLVSEKSTMVRLRVGAPYQGFNARPPLMRLPLGETINTNMEIIPQPTRIFLQCNVGLVQTQKNAINHLEMLIKYHFIDVRLPKASNLWVEQFLYF